MNQAVRGRRDSDEEWRPIPDFEGLYEVSDFGRIRSCRGGIIRILKGGRNRDGYPLIRLCKAGVHRHFKVHRIVCLVFNGPPLCAALHTEVAHLDGSRDNARPENLRWVSHTENMSHRIQHGTHPVGERHPGALLTSETVIAALEMLATGATCREVASQFGVSANTINDIRRKRNWRHIKGPPAAYLASRGGWSRSTGNGQGGAKNHCAKLTDEQASEIRRRKLAGESPADLSREFGIARDAIWRVSTGRSYKSAKPAGE